MISSAMSSMSETKFHKTSIRPSQSLRRHFLSLGRQVLRWSEQRPIRTVTLGVTCLNGDEGTSTVSFNLASALTTLVGCDVLFVESDFGSSYLSRKKEVGLSEVLQGTAEADDLIRKFRENEHLFAMESGKVKEKESIELPVHNLSAVIQERFNRFDYVVFDLPVSDGLTACDSLASQLDGVLLVVDGTAINREQVATFRTRMKRLGVEIVGLAVNKAKY